jgi:hypothetical protein
MTKIKQMHQFFVLAMICICTPGCAIPTGGWTKPTSQWAGIDEVTVLKDLYDDTNRLLALSSKQRIRQYKNLQKTTDQQATLRDHLLLAVFLGGLEPSLVDYKKAGQELMKAQQQATSSPLIMSYIHSQSGLIEQLNKVQRMPIKAIIKHDKRTREPVREVVVVEDSSSKEQALTGQISDLEAQLQDRNSRISELEAKIQALSAIERSLNQRTQ